PRPRGAAPEQATLGDDDDMLSAEEFQDLQRQLQTTATARGQESTRGLISDHMLPGYLGRIRQQMG
ncbi:MAG: hypothetical protein VKP70_01290, partial [Cyanobacteriota bacterium]|nr:hypothetical protein [Cyanobacteriota bacterium]